MQSDIDKTIWFFYIVKFLNKGLECSSNFEKSQEILETETTFFNTKAFNSAKFNKYFILDVRTHFKPTETFQCINAQISCHPPGITRGFIEGEVLRLLRTNSSQFL